MEPGVLPVRLPLPVPLLGGQPVPVVHVPALLLAAHPAGPTRFCSLSDPQLEIDRSFGTYVVH